MSTTVGPHGKNPPKIKLKKFVKLTDNNYACNDLANFEAHVKTGNGNYVNLLKLAGKVSLFSADFSHLEPLCLAKPPEPSAYSS